MPESFIYGPNIASFVLGFLLSFASAYSTYIFVKILIDQLGGTSKPNKVAYLFSVLFAFGKFPFLIAYIYFVFAILEYDWLSFVVGFLIGVILLTGFFWFFSRNKIP